MGRQVLLLRNTSSEYDKCEELLESQLTLCEEAPHLPISPHISPHPESQLTLCEEAPHLPTSPHIPPYLPISRVAAHALRGGARQ